jgi:hypothetical protein
MTRSSQLLIDEPPLQVLPTLAQLIGLNEAITLQQVHYWLSTVRKTKGERMGRIDRSGQAWIFNRYEAWQEDNFPFWSVPTIRRIFKNLVEWGLVKCKTGSQLDLDPVDRPRSRNGIPDQTLWYSIDYDRLNLVLDGQPVDKPPSDQPDQMAHVINLNLPCDQVDQLHVINLSPPSDQLDHMLNKNQRLPETTTEITQRNVQITPSNLWNMIAQQLRDEMSVADYLTWVQPLRPENSMQPGRLTIKAVNAFGRDWCTSRLGTKVNRLATALAGQEIKVVFQLESQ